MNQQPPNVVKALRRLVEALKADDYEAYWKAFEEFLALHEGLLSEAVKEETK